MLLYSRTMIFFYLLNVTVTIHVDNNGWKRANLLLDEILRGAIYTFVPPCNHKSRGSYVVKVQVTKIEAMNGLKIRDVTNDYFTKFMWNQTFRFLSFLYQNATDLYPLLILILEFVIKLKIPMIFLIGNKFPNVNAILMRAREVDIFEVGSEKV